jgi:hypothetical protein
MRAHWLHLPGLEAQVNDLVGGGCPHEGKTVQREVCPFCELEAQAREIARLQGLLPAAPPAPAPTPTASKILACSVCGWTAEPCVHVGGWLDRHGPVNERESPRLALRREGQPEGEFVDRELCPRCGKEAFSADHCGGQHMTAPAPSPGEEPSDAQLAEWERFLAAEVPGGSSTFVHARYVLRLHTVAHEAVAALRRAKETK